MRLTLAKSMWTAARQRPDIDTQGLDTDDWLYLADAALAALGLDDLDAFVEQAWGHYSHPDEDEPESAEIDAMRTAIAAAFTHSAAEGTQS